MQFNSLAEVWAMGGYGAYVWSSILIVVVAIAWLTLDSLALKKKTLKSIQQQQERAEKIRQAKTSGQNKGVIE